MLKKHLQLRVSSAAVGPAPAFPVRPRSQTRRDLFPPITSCRRVFTKTQGNRGKSQRAFLKTQ